MSIIRRPTNCASAQKAYTRSGTMNISKKLTVGTILTAVWNY